MNCGKHRDREAVGTCSECGKAVCRECKTEYKNKNYCSDCIDDLVSNITYVAGVIPRVQLSGKARVIQEIAAVLLFLIGIGIGYVIGVEVATPY